MSINLSVLIVDPGTGGSRKFPVIDTTRISNDSRTASRGFTDLNQELKTDNPRTYSLTLLCEDPEEVV